MKADTHSIKDLIVALLTFGVMVPISTAAEMPSRKEVVSAIEAVSATVSDADAKAAAIEHAMKLEKGWGRELSILAVSDYIATNKLRMEDVDAVRTLGAQLSPDFYIAVAHDLAKVSSPDAKRRLMTVLRDGEPVLVKSALTPFLGDLQPSETLTPDEQAHGYRPFRVCDVAYNVIQEKIASNITEAAQVNSSESDAVRNRQIASLCTSLGVQVPSSVSPTPAANAAEKPEKGASGILGKSGSGALKSNGQNSNERSWLVWLLVVIVATVGAVWVFLRKSK